MRVARRAIGRCCRTAEGRAGTYRIAAKNVSGARWGAAHAALTGHVARDALRVWRCAHSAASRACGCSSNG
jgi:hypothetical protein